MKSYTVRLRGFILGQYREEGATIDLDPRQARTFENEGRIEEAKPETAKKGKAAKDDGAK